MEKDTYITILYDIYSSLLTESQREYFEEYYFNDYSLSEISENNNISRSAIHKHIKTIEIRLKEFESKLHLYEKSKKIDEIIAELEDKRLANKLIQINKL